MGARLTLSGLLGFLVLGSAGAASGQPLNPEEQLGKSIFFDRNLSRHRNQSCSGCHLPEAGWTGPQAPINAGGAIYEGSVPYRLGSRKPPSVAYAPFSPVLFTDVKGGELTMKGGAFWDGRATGAKLGNPAADQAQEPFLNPLEMALPDSACVVYRVCFPAVPPAYPVRLQALHGDGLCDVRWPMGMDAMCSLDDAPVWLPMPDRFRVEQAYDLIALALAAYESSVEVSAFTSKFDHYLRGQAVLTPPERWGLELFNGKARCHSCHTSNIEPSGAPPLFTDFTYANTGVARNPLHPIYQMPPRSGPFDLYASILGLGGPLAPCQGIGCPAGPNLGKHKVPTLRNVDKRPHQGFVKAYMHNGFFKSLHGVVHFYNTRNVKPRCPPGLVVLNDISAMQHDCWPEPEVPVNIDTYALGNLGLTPDEEWALVAFLRTLSDGYWPWGP